MLALAALVAALSFAQAVPDRARAEQLAREGRPAEALQIFQQVLAANPSDSDARVWIGRLNLRLGRPGEAEAAFRAVLAQHPGEIDATVGLGGALMRQGDWQQALDVLKAVEPAAGENADVFGALAAAYRRAGDDRSALDYFQRARTLSPADTDLQDGYENTVKAYGHGIAFEGFGQEVTPGSTAQSGALLLRVRATPRFWVRGLARVQTGDGYTDNQYGGGFEWRATRTTTVSAGAAGGSNNTALANLDAGGNVVHYQGAFEVGAIFRELSFTDAGVTTISPTLAWDEGGFWRFDGRYTYSYSRFSGTGQSKGDNSGMLRATARTSRRVWLNGTYAYGIESFEDLTADRIASLGGHTAAGGVKLMLRSLTTIDATWEHQWRSNASRLDRVTVTLSQYFP